MQHERRFPHRFLPHNTGGLHKGKRTMEYCVYCHISPSNKRYIGITSQRLSDRWCNGNGYKDNEHFYRAIKKYGWESFQHLVLFEGLTRDEASAKEKELIAKYETTNRSKGYNFADGGFGGGHPLSEETKRKISDAKRGKCCPEYQKLWLSKLNKGKMPTNIDALHAGNQKQVLQFDLEGNYIASFPSIRIAGRTCHIHESNIGACCRGVCATTGNYIWRFGCRTKVKED